MAKNIKRFQERKKEKEKRPIGLPTRRRLLGLDSHEEDSLISQNTKRKKSAALILFELSKKKIKRRKERGLPDMTLQLKDLKLF